MKRKIAWLALPLILGALIFAVWRAAWREQHPMPTKEDLEIRSLLSKNSVIKLSHVNWNGPKGEYKATLSKSSFRAFIQCLHISPIPSEPVKIGLGQKGEVIITGEDRASTFTATINFDESAPGTLNVPSSGNVEKRDIHPVTIRKSGSGSGGEF